MAYITGFSDFATVVVFKHQTRIYKDLFLLLACFCSNDFLIFLQPPGLLKWQREGSVSGMIMLLFYLIYNFFLSFFYSVQEEGGLVLWDQGLGELGNRIWDKQRQHCGAGQVGRKHTLINVFFSSSILDKFCKCLMEFYCINYFAVVLRILINRQNVPCSIGHLLSSSSIKHM